MIGLLDAYEKLESSEIFLEWRMENEESYLVHFFTMVDSNDVAQDWQVGYYNPNKDMVVTFIVGQEEITMNPQTEVFNEHKGIKSFDINLVKINVDQAKDIAKRVQQKKYSAHLPLKTIFLLQNVEEGQVWNVTHITQSFKTLNIKIDCENGDIVSNQLVEIFNFK